MVGSIPPRLHRGAGLDAQLRSCGGSQGRENLRWVIGLAKTRTCPTAWGLAGAWRHGLLGSDGVFCL